MLVEKRQPTGKLSEETAHSGCPPKLQHTTVHQPDTKSNCECMQLDAWFRAQASIASSCKYKTMSSTPQGSQSRISSKRDKVIYSNLHDAILLSKQRQIDVN